MLRILLINPKFPMQHPPLGLGYLSSYLKKHLGVSVEVRVFDENVSEDILAVISEFEPGLIGISIVTPTFRRAVSLCQRIRTVTAAPIIAGGIHVTVVPECVMQAPIDVGMVGEGEATFLELVRYFLKTGQVRNNNIAGIAYRENDSFVKTPARPLIANLDTIPPPDRSLFDMKHYTHWGIMAHGLYAKGTSMMPSRGCPFHTCDFCSSRLMWGNSVRFFSPQYVVSEMESIVDEYCLNFIIFLDDNFTTNLEWLEELFVLMEERGLTKRIRFDCESIAAYMNDARAALLNKMGCVRVEFGFESGSPRILHILKSGKCGVEQNERAIDVCRRYGLSILGNMIYGYIDETPEEFDESVNWFLKWPIDYIAPHLYTPYPGTPGWNKCIARKLIDPNNIDWEQFQTADGGKNIYVNTVLSPEEIERHFQALCYKFAHRKKIIVITNGLSLKERLRFYYQAVKREKVVPILRAHFSTLYYLLRWVKRKVRSVFRLFD